MDKELTLNDIYEGLMAGKKYVLKRTLRSDWQAFMTGKLRYYVPGGFNEIHKTHSFGEDYFSYTYYGSSAVTATKDNLKWLLETIFECDPSDFTELNHHAILDVINEGR